MTFENPPPVCRFISSRISLDPANLSIAITAFFRRIYEWKCLSPIRRAFPCRGDTTISAGSPPPRASFASCPATTRSRAFALRPFRFFSSCLAFCTTVRASVHGINSPRRLFDTFSLPLPFLTPFRALLTEGSSLPQFWLRNRCSCAPPPLICFCVA